MKRREERERDQERGEVIRNKERRGKKGGRGSLLWKEEGRRGDTVYGTGRGEERRGGKLSMERGEERNGWNRV